MTTRRRFVHAGQETRRADLIEATLSLIAEGGPEAATVRAIAMRAGVTPGLIRHYFSTKEDLIAAAHQHLMSGLTAASAAQLDHLPDDPLARLSAFIANAVSPPVTDPRAVSLWAASMQMVARDEKMREVHRETYLEFRDILQTMIHDALQSVGHPTSQAQTLAIAGNALLDGLWIEAGALPEMFEDGRLKPIAINAFSRLLQLDLPED